MSQIFNTFKLRHTINIHSTLLFHYSPNYVIIHKMCYETKLIRFPPILIFQAESL